MSGPMVIFEPASAIAASRCLAARVRDSGHRVTASHPRRCGWCDYPTDVLDGLVRGFNAWAGYSERTGTYAHHELRVWAELGKDEQLSQIVAAQVLEDEPWTDRVGGSDSSGGRAGSRTALRSRVPGETGSNVPAEAMDDVAPPPADAVPAPDWLAPGPGGPS
jgi:hypothetical protein